jgi:hypothetical protein
MTPSHWEKKSKSFCSTNRYVILATEDNNVEPTVISTNTVIDSEQLIPLEEKKIPMLGLHQSILKTLL